jgi:hypothetical protein
MCLSVCLCVCVCVCQSLSFCLGMIPQRTLYRAWGRMTGGMVMSILGQIGLSLVVLVVHDVVLQCHHEPSPLVVIHYALPVVLLLNVLTRSVLYILHSSTFDSAERFWVRTHSMARLKQPLCHYHMLIRINVAVILSMGAFDTIHVLVVAPKMLLIESVQPWLLFCIETGATCHNVGILIACLVLLASLHIYEERLFRCEVNLERRETTHKPRVKV